jgi:hypothetical protein
MGMRRLGSVGLCMAAAVAICAATAASASAVAPQFGRCVKTKAGGGGYANAQCTETVSTGAGYEWLSGPGSSAQFTASAGRAALETSGGEKVECGTTSGAGEYTGLQTEELTITFTGCKLSGVACQSGATAGEIVSSPLEGLLGLVKRESEPISNEVGIGYYPPSGEAFAQFECGSTTVLVSGSVIHQVKVNKMLSHENQKFKLQRGRSNAGEQKPECFDAEWEDPLIAERCGVLGASVNGSASVQTGLTWPSALSNAEKIEVNTTV